MQVDHFLHIFHFAVQWQFQSSEHLGNHLCADEVVVVKRPPVGIVPTLAFWFADVVHQRSPSQPQVVRAFAHIVEHLQGVVEIVFVCPSVACLHDVEGCKFGQNQLQQSAAVQVNQTLARRACHHDLVQFGLYAFSADDFDP